MLWPVELLSGLKKIELNAILFGFEQQVTETLANVYCTAELYEGSKACYWGFLLIRPSLAPFSGSFPVALKYTRNPATTLALQLPRSKNF